MAKKKKSWEEIQKLAKTNQYGQGNIDLRNRPVVKNDDGSISTVRSMSFYDDKEKKEILIPTVVKGKVVSDKEAINHYRKTGEYLGKFNTVDEANNYAEKLHEQQDRLYGNPLDNNQLNIFRNAQPVQPKQVNLLEQNQRNMSTWDKVVNNMAYTGATFGNELGGGLINTAQMTNADTLNYAQRKGNQGVVKAATDFLSNYANPIQNGVPGFNLNDPVGSLKDILKTGERYNNIINSDAPFGEKLASLVGETLTNVKEQLPGFKDVMKASNVGFEAASLVTGKDKNQIIESLSQENRKLSKGYEQRRDNLQQDQSVGGVTKTVANVGGQIARMLPSIGLNQIAPGTGLLQMGQSAGGSKLNERLDQGDNLSQAVNRANITEATEIGTEMMFEGANKLASGTVAKLPGVRKITKEAKKWVEDNVKSKLSKKVLNLIKDAAGENIEEIVSDYTDYIVSKAYGEDAEFGLNTEKETMLYTTLTELTLGILFDGMVGINTRGNKKVVNNSNLDTMTKENLTKFVEDNSITRDGATALVNGINNIENKTEINKLLKSGKLQEVVDYIGNARQTERENIINSSDLSDEEKASLLRVVQAKNIPGEQVQRAIDNKLDEDTRRTLFNNLDVVEDEQGNRTYFEKQATKIENNDNLKSTYKKYYGNNKTALYRNLDNIESIGKEIGARTIFDGNEFKVTKEEAAANPNLKEGAIKTNVEAFFRTRDGKREIVINPYADTKKSFERIFSHELTHGVLGTNTEEANRLKKTVEEFWKKQYGEEKYNDMVKDLKAAYGKNFNDEELTAKTIEQLFTRQEDLNTLANSNPNIFTRIYRNLVSIYAKLTGSEKAYVKKIKLDMELAWSKSKNKDSLQNASNKYSQQTNLDNKLELSTQDSEGRTLSKETQDFLINSKAVDSNGHPIKLYHGTNQAGFSKVNNYLFLTTNREIAQDYAGGDKTYDPNNPNSDLTPIQTNGKNSYFKNVGEIKNNINEYTLGDLQAIWDFIDENNGFSDTIYDYDLENDLDKQIKNIDSSAVQDIVNATLEELNNWNSDDTIPIPSLSNEQVSDSNLYTENRKIYETYANIENPLEMDLQGGKVTNEMINNAKQEGYDGIIAHNTGEGRGNKKGDTYIVFNENQLIDANNDNIKYSIEDSQGRKLTKEQQEYFKDSKVRDENGNLIPMYHGTKDNFNVFEYNKGNKYDSGYAGKGFYFVDDIKSARDYSEWKKGHNGSRVIETYLNITNPLDLGDVNGIKGVLKERLGLENLSENPMHITEEESQSISNKIKEMGYDGLVYNFDGKKYAVVYDSNQIKNVDNKKPTSNPDIRYSIETEEFDKRLESNFPTPATHDNHGRELAKGMAEKMKNSKARDLKNGGLVNVFHTTGSYADIPQFNEFEPRRDNYYKFGKQIVNYFTDDKEMSGSYASQKYKMADTKKLNDIKEAQDFIKGFGDYTIEELEDGAVIFDNKENEAFKIAEDFAKTLDSKQKKELKAMLDRGSMEGYFDDHSIEENNWLIDNVLPKYDEFLRQNRDKEYRKAIQSYLGDYLNQKGIQPIKEYSSTKELLRNIKSDFQEGSNFRNYGAWQYSGYVDIQNPFVIDAEGRNWNMVESQSNDFIDELDEEVPQEVKDNLTNLYRKSENISAELRDKASKYDEAVSDLITNSSDNDTVAMIRLIQRLDVSGVENLLNGYDDILGTSDIFGVADTLKSYGIIDSNTFSEMMDEYKIPDNIKEWIRREWTKELNNGKGVKIDSTSPKINNLEELFHKKRDAYHEFEKYRYPSDYFKEVIMGSPDAEDFVDLGYELGDILDYRVQLRGEDVVSDELAQAASVGFSKPQLIRIWGTSKTTNDIVKQVIEYNNGLFEDSKQNEELAEEYGLSSEETSKNRTQEELLNMGGYDGVIIKNVVDYGGKSENVAPHDLYITFGSNQFKAIDNENPTNDPDIRYSKKTTEDWTEYLTKYSKGGTKTYLPQISGKLPTRKITNQDFLDVISSKTNLPQEEIDSARNIINQINKTEESLRDFDKQLTTLDNMYAETNQETQQAPQNIDDLFDEVGGNEVESPLSDRNIETIGKETKTNAYQYENPEVKPYFQEMAQRIGEDLSYVSDKMNRRTVKGGGTKLHTNTKALNDLHNKFGYSYEQIANGLNDIIEDHGSENNAVSKKIEFYIDEALRNGYRNSLGQFIEPNQGYIDTISYSMNIDQNNEDESWTPEQIEEDNQKRTNALKQAYRELQNIYNQSKDVEFLQSKYNELEKLETTTNNEYDREKYRAMQSDIYGVIHGRASLLEDAGIQDFMKEEQQPELPRPQVPTAKNTQLPYSPTTDEDLQAIRDNSILAQEPEITPERVEEGVEKDTLSYLVEGRTKTKMKNLKDEFMQKFINKGHYVDKLAKATGNKALTYKYDRMLTSFAEAQVCIGDEQVIRKNGENQVVGKSLNDVYKPAVDAKLLPQFEDYLLNRHNIDRFAYEKGVYGTEVSSKDSQKNVAKYEEIYPEFKEWAEDVYAYNRNSIQELVNEGLISQEFYDKLTSMYGSYVPTFRDIQEMHEELVGEGSVGHNVIKKATGSRKPIISPRLAMAEQTIAFKKAIATNEVGKELYKSLGKKSKIFEGLNFDNVAIESLGGNVVEKGKDGNNTFMIFDKGEATQFKISDDLYSAFDKNTIFKKVNNNELASALLTPIEKLTKAQRNLLTTYSVGFAFNNPIKDYQDALYNTKYTAPEFAKNYTVALHEIATNGKMLQEAKRNGLGANTYYDFSKGILPETKSKLKKVGNKVMQVNEVIELAPRLAEYITTREHGGTIDEALYNAAEITTNFKRGGDITKFVNKYGANFVNASVQGLDKQIRNITENNSPKGYARLVFRAVTLGVLPAVINHLLLDDDDDYQDLPDYIKDSYYLLPSKNEGEFYRIPKGRVLAVLGATARRTMELAQGEGDAFDDYWKEVWGNNLAPNNPLTDNLISPIKQALDNNAWYDGKIVSARLQKKPKAEQSDERTDKFSKFVGENIGKLPQGTRESIEKIPVLGDLFSIAESPKLLNYVLDQYSGGPGDVILPHLTPFAEDSMLANKFTTNAILKNKNVEAFYEALENAETMNNSDYATDSDKLAYKYLSGVSKDVGALYSDKREIQNDSTLKDKEKKAKTLEIQKEINKQVEEALEKLNEMKLDNDYASFDGTEYYKNDKGEWKEIDSEDVADGLSNQTYSDYKNKSQKALSEKKKRENKDNAQLTDKERISLVLSSTYTNKEKDLIYDNYIRNDSDKDYAAYKILNGVDGIDNYLNYKSTDFTSDKVDDGTVNGKAVKTSDPGSKKNKIINYIENSDFDSLTKLYLYGTNYKLSKTERKEFDNMLNQKNLTPEQKKQIYLTLNGVVEMKDGSIQWK